LVDIKPKIPLFIKILPPFSDESLFRILSLSGNIDKRARKKYMSDTSPSTSSTGLFAPKPPSANLRAPIRTGSKKIIATDVTSAAWQIVAGIGRLPGKL
jgi:hypothetical protein